ncbi:hypothetical protein ACTXT7_009071 [Hymenolepis weldensis]
MAKSLDPPSKTTISATEFDTELFQTDIRELSQELPENADDSNPNMLPPPARHETSERKDTKIYCSEPTKTVSIRHPTQKPQTPTSTMEDHKASTSPRPH